MDFSVISSILSPTDIGVFVSENYALAGGATCRILKAGVNHTYRVDSATGTFIFRIYSLNWRTKEEITEELNLLRLLRQHAVSVSYPIPDRSGSLIQTLNAPEGTRFGVLFSYAEGSKTQNYGEESHFEVGKLMAQLHSVTMGMILNRPVYSPGRLLDIPIAAIGQFLSEETEELQSLLHIRTLLEQELMDVDESSLRQGVVHLDIWFDNLALSDRSGITLFDFDFCGNGWLCLDLAYYHMQLGYIEKEEEERTRKLEAFYSGYGSVLQINPAEKRLIPVLGICLHYFYLGVQCSRFDNWSNVFINEAYLKRYITVFIRDGYRKIKGVGL